MLKNPKSAKLEAMLKHAKPTFIYKTIVTIIMMVIAIECLSRLYLFQQFHHFFPNRNHILKAYYPELNELNNIIHNNNRYDYEILILGASVTNNSFGSIRENLEKRLSNQTNQSVRVTNLSRPAHSSLDSFLKYSAIEHPKFDLVIIYHNINELRSNHVPDNLFKSNYTHLDWYATIDKHLSHSDRLTPFATEYILTLLSYHLKNRHLSPLPNDSVRPEWIHHGKTIKTALPFRKNINAILTLAKKRQTKTLLMTFAYHLPKNYSPSKFSSEALDYTFKKGHSFPLSIWGNKETLSIGLESHNAILKDFHQNDPSLLFVDQNSHIPKNKAYFNDVCHLTDVGGRQFVNNLLTVISPEIIHKNMRQQLQTSTNN